MKHLLCLSLLVALLVTLTSCAASELAQPQVAINAPVSGGQFQTGQDVTVQSTTSSNQGIARVELMVDGQIVRADTPPVKGQNQFAVVQTWKATSPGSHTIIVRATNERGAAGEAGINIHVVSVTAVATGAAPTPNAPVPTSAGAPVATALPTVNMAAPTAAVAPPAPTFPPGRPTPTPITSGTKYTLVLTQDQIAALLNSALSAAERDYVSTQSVSLQNGQISSSTTYKGLGGKTVDGTLVLAVSASNCDVNVAVVQATIGQVSMTDARKAAISANMRRLLSSTLAQYHDYRCVESITIINGVMTVVYY